MAPSSSKGVVANSWKGYLERLPPQQQPVPIQELTRQRHQPNKVDHSYTDYSNVPAPPNVDLPTAVSKMNFAQKVHDALSRDEFDHALCWMPHGRAFRIRSAKSLEVTVCPRYFGHSKLSLLVQDLRKHGFKEITKGQDRNCEYNVMLNAWLVRP